MKPKFIATVVGMLSIACMATATKASATEPDLYEPLEYNTLRLEPGVAFPFNRPQRNYYQSGAAVSAKLDLHITPWVSVFPSVTFVGLSEGDLTSPSGHDVGTDWSFGLGLRVGRPHDKTNNTGHGWSAYAPWVDGQPDYIRTAGLNRFGFQVATGVYFPVTDARVVWTGPFLAYQQITDGTSVGGTPGMDNTDAHIGIVGWGFEFGAPPKAAAQAPIQPEVKKDITEVVVTQEPTPETPPQTVDVGMRIKSGLTVQFDFNSSKLSDDYQEKLNDFASNAIKELQDHPEMTVEMDGHASDEHHPWATEHNQKLSEKRAQVVKDYLVAAGVPANSLTVKGFGTSQPIDTNETAEGRAHNRRVEFLISVTLHCTTGKDCQ
jgi:outer membrane protein OmpA-like peptidoglycan-associated protein